MPVVSSASVAVSQFQERILVETGLASYLERGVKDSERMRIGMCWELYAQLTVPA